MITMNDPEAVLSKDLVQSLLKMGWPPSFKAHLEDLNDGTLVPARVVGVRKNSFYVSQGKGEWPATAAGRLNHQIDGLYPVAGDWVLIADTVIYRVLPRKNALSRGAAGTHGQQNALPTREQVIAANLDRLIEGNPELGYHIMHNIAKTLCTRIRNANLALRNALIWI